MCQVCGGSCQSGGAVRAVCGSSHLGYQFESNKIRGRDEKGIDAGTGCWKWPGEL